MSPSSQGLSEDQLEDLQSFLKDWLRHSGRTQSDLRRALRASSIRMPVLLEELQHTYRDRGLAALAERLCGIDATWRSEDQSPRGPSPASGADDALNQLDLLLQEIREEQQP